MTLMGKSNPLGGAVCAYTPGTILFDGSNGDSATLQMKRDFTSFAARVPEPAAATAAFTEPAAEAVPVPVLKETSISPTTKTT